MRPKSQPLPARIVCAGDGRRRRRPPSPTFLTRAQPPRPAARPKVAILREQGVNGQVEMAWAFQTAGFTAVDVHMSDLIRGDVTLDGFRGVPHAQHTGFAVRGREFPSALLNGPHGQSRISPAPGLAAG